MYLIKLTVNYIQKRKEGNYETSVDYYYQVKDLKGIDKAYESTLLKMSKTFRNYSIESIVKEDISKMDSFEII